MGEAPAFQDLREHTSDKVRMPSVQPQRANLRNLKQQAAYRKVNPGDAARGFESSRQRV